MAGLFELIDQLPAPQADAPTDGRDFVSFGGQGTGQPVTYYPLDRPDPVLAELRAAYEKRHPAQQQAPAPQPMPDAAPEPVARQQAPQGTPPSPSYTLPPDELIDPNMSSQQAGQQAVEAYEKQRQLETTADRNAAAAEKNNAQLVGEELGIHRDVMATLEKEKVAAVGAQTEKVRRIADEARNTKIDPQRLHKNANTGQKIAGFLGVVLGGLLLPYQGKNPALEIINRKIEQDIDAQKANLDNLNQSVANERSILSDLRQQYGDQKAAELSLHGITLEQYANQLTADLAGVKDQRAVARGMELRGQILEKAGQYHKQAEDAAAAAAERNFQHKMAKDELAQRGQIARDRNATDEQIARDRDATDLAIAGMNLVPKLGKDSANASANGGKGAVSDDTIVGVQMIDEPADSTNDRVTFAEGTNPTKMATVRDLVSTSHNINDLVADITTLGTERNLLPDERKRIVNSAMANIRLTKQALVKGVASEGDQKIIDKGVAITDPQAFLNWLDEDETKRVLQYTADATIRETNTKLRPHGLRLAPHTAQPLTGQSAPLEENPETKVKAAREASTSFNPGNVTRKGDVAYSASDRMKRYLEVTHTPVSSYKSLSEIKTHRAELVKDVAELGKAADAEKDPRKKNELRANQTAAYLAQQHLEDLLREQKDLRQNSRALYGGNPSRLGALDD